MKGRTRPCGPSEAKGYRQKAQAFLRAADLVEANASPDDRLHDVLFSLYVHAGIAAADALCCAIHGERAAGEGHHEAVPLLAAVRPGGATLARSLGDLLRLKGRAEYSHDSVGASDVKMASRRARALVAAASERVT